MVSEKFKRIFSSRSSKDNNRPRGAAHGQLSRQHQPPKEANTSPDDQIRGDVLVDPDRVSISEAAPSGNQPVQTCPPEEPSKSPSPTPKDSHTSIHELWNLSYEKLRDEDEDLIADYEAKLCGDLGAGLASTLGSKIDMRDRMETVLRRKMDDINRDTWKLKFGSSKVQVRDLVKPVLGVVDWANKYITDAVSANSYASLAWGGISLLLPLFLNPSNQGASLAKGLEHISSLIAQSRMWEDLYNRYESNTEQQGSSLQSRTVYKGALENLYREILRFQISSYCYYAKNDAFRQGLDIIRWNNWDELVGNIERKEHKFFAINNSWRDVRFEEEYSAAKKRHQDAIRHWQTIGADTSRLLKAVQDAQEEKNRDGFLKWLCSIDPSTLYNAARRKHTSGTSDWLVKSSEFKNWGLSPRSLLWLHGKPGAGKSTLSSSVIYHLKNRYNEQDPKVVLAYFFFSFSDIEKQNVDGMLASLIKQLYASRSDTPQPVESLREYKKKGERPDTKTLEAALIATVRGFSAVFIVIDALDECPMLNGEQKMLLDSLSRIFAVMPGNIHIFCTSRPEPDINTKMSTILSSPSKAAIDLTNYRGGLDHDIGIYLDSTFASTDYTWWPGNLKAEAKASLIKNADGMFQYVFCQFEILRKLGSVSSVRKALQELPDGLDATYDRLLQNIDDRFKPQVGSLLKWLASSNRLLRIKELAEIFAFRFGPECAVTFDEVERLFKPEAVLNYVSSLIVTQQDRDKGRHDIQATPARPPAAPRVRLAHFTIKEYLTSSRIAEGTRRFSFTETDAHLHIAHLCLAYHLHVSAMSENDHDFPLEDYAIQNWMLHLEKIPREKWPPEVASLAARALSIRSRSLSMMIRGTPGPVRTFHWCRPDTLSYPHGNGYWECLNMRWRPQSHTARLGFLHLTDMLLCEGLGVNGYLTQEDLDAALQEAAYGGHTAVVQLLLNRGADVNAEGKTLGSALHAAAYRGHGSVIQLLLDRSANVNAQHAKIGTAIQVAASQDHFHAVQRLVEHGAAIDLPPNEAGCALTSAVPTTIFTRAEDVVETPSAWVLVSGRFTSVKCLQFLLDRGTNTGTHGGTYGMALHKAAANLPASKAHFHLLLERGADVNGRGGRYSYPLQALCTRGQAVRADVATLVNMGADVNAQGGEYGTALQAACYFHDAVRDDSIIKLLLNRGANVNAPGGKYGTALQAACARPVGSDIIEFLLEQGADVSIQGGKYGNALQAACHNAGLDGIRLLLNRGADVNAPGGVFGSALQAAASLPFHYTDKILILELLLSKGADINMQGGKYGTALQAACRARFSGDDHIVRLLLNHGAEVNAEGGKYGTALQAACQNNNIDGVRVLLDNGAEVNARGGKYGFALQAACHSGDTSIASLLIKHGADVHIHGGMFGSAWHAAAVNHFPADDDMLELLLDHGVDTRGRLQRDALRAVLCSEWDEPQTIDRVRFLLDHGADVNLRAGDYGFPLQSACTKKTGTRTKFLLEYCPNVEVNAAGGMFGFALQAAAYSGQTESVKLLLGKGANVDARGGKYGSALNAAVVKGFWDIVEVLLESGAKPDSQQLPEADEEWLARVREEDGRGAVERYRGFWEMKKIKEA